MPHSQVYTPPHASSFPRSAGPRSLGDVAHATQYWHVELQCTEATSFDKCPAALAEPSQGRHSHSVHKQVMLLFPHAADDTIAQELVEWFKHEVCDQSSSCAGNTQEVHLGLPAHISKQERACWHKLAEQHGLLSQSQGVGPQRQLFLKPRTASKAGSAVSAEAKQIWEWCQLEGGHMWTYSQGEVQDMLRPAGQMPPEVEQMVMKRKDAKQLAKCLQARDAAGALELLSSDDLLVWTRDDDSGGYPLHIAVYHGLTDVVNRLLQTPNVTEQRDGRRDTPLMLARRCGHVHIEQLLLTAGAKDPAISQVPPSLRPGSGTPYSSWSRSARNAYARGSQSSSCSTATPHSRPPPGLSKADAADSWAGPPGFRK